MSEVIFQVFFSTTLNAHTCIYVCRVWVFILYDVITLMCCRWGKNGRFKQTSFSYHTHTYDAHMLHRHDTVFQLKLIPVTSGCFTKIFTTRQIFLFLFAASMLGRLGPDRDECGEQPFPDATLL